MSRPRVELQAILEELLGSRNVYFQPPESLKLKYPCIVYNLNTIPTRKADNTTYLSARQYLVTVIDYDPDSDFVDKMLELKYCSFDRAYASNGLNHFVFSLHF